MFKQFNKYKKNSTTRELFQNELINSKKLILPVFVREGIDSPKEISSMPGVFQYDLDSLKKVVSEAAKNKLGGIMLFGVPLEEKKNAKGTDAINENNILAKAIRIASKEAGDKITIQSDICLDEFTDHGHCGVLKENGLINVSETLKRYKEMSELHIDAGSAILGFSGMMDGQIEYINKNVSKQNLEKVLLLAYSAKFSSSLYGPFREAVNSSLKGDRKTYQIDYKNPELALRQLYTDEKSGADILMVKPAGMYLDTIFQAKENTLLPVWAYQVSGEYAQIELAAKAGVLDREKLILESTYAIFRSGADAILSYYALEIGKMLNAYF